MSKRKPSAYIMDMLRCIQHIQEYTSKISLDDFSSNFMVVEACLYNIQIIGEAVSNLPADVKNMDNQIPWASIKGMRNRLIHDYIGTDIQLVWTVINSELPSFKTRLNQIHTYLIEQNK